MGHFLFIIMHFMAILFGFVFLFITIPLHMIYSSLHNKNKAKKERNVVRDSYIGGM
jgi:hypothetical protein